jgi:hypothetical protein
MSSNNPLWGAPRIHGELLKLGIDIRRDQRRQVHRTQAEAAVTKLAHFP